MTDSENPRSSLLESLAIIVVVVMLCLSASAVNLTHKSTHIGQQASPVSEANIQP